MLLKAALFGYLVIGLTTSAPTPAPQGSRSTPSQNSNNQYDNSNGQYDSGSDQYNGVNNQDEYNDRSNQYNSNNNVGTNNRNSQYDNSQSFNSGQYEDSKYARITKYDYDNDGSGSYAYKVSQSDGIYNEQVGEVQNQGTDEEGSRVYGYYGYPGPDGKYYYVEYVADKDGFRPAGDHIPRAASVGRVGQLGIPSAAIASLAGGGLG